MAETPSIRPSLPESLRCFYSYTDDADTTMAVGNTHASYDILTVLMQNIIDGGNNLRFFHNDADEGDSGFHNIRSFPKIKNAVSMKDTARSTVGRAATVEFISLRIFHLNHISMSE